MLIVRQCAPRHWLAQHAGVLGPFSVYPACTNDGDAAIEEAAALNAEYDANLVTPHGFTQGSIYVEPMECACVS